MSFGGAVSAMIHSLKSNKRDRKTLFDKKGALYNDIRRKALLTDKKATAEQLTETRNRIKKERRNRYIKIFGLISLILLSILILTYI